MNNSPQYACLYFRVSDLIIDLHLLLDGIPSARKHLLRFSRNEDLENL